MLILGTGPGIVAHCSAIESYIRRTKPIVLALNTQSVIDNKLIDFRVACHPVRLLADLEMHATLPQPLITPLSMLPETLQNEMKGKELRDFGLVVHDGEFSFHETYCVAPSSLVLAYSLAIGTCGKANSIVMAGFDGYDRGDARNEEIESLLSKFTQSGSTCEIFFLLLPQNTQIFNLGCLCH